MPTGGPQGKVESRHKDSHVLGTIVRLKADSCVLLDVRVSQTVRVHIQRAKTRNRSCSDESGVQAASSQI